MFALRSTVKKLEDELAVIKRLLRYVELDDRSLPHTYGEYGPEWPRRASINLGSVVRSELKEEYRATHSSFYPQEEKVGKKK